MLLEAISDFLPMAVGAALSPIPIAAVVTILLSVRPANATAFLLGWVIGILAVGTLTLLIPGLCTDRGEPTQLSGWIRLVLGGSLLLLAARKWQRRPAPDEPVEVPKMLARMDSNTYGQSLIVGLTLSAVNPKNLVLTFTGSAAIDASVTNPSKQMIALAIYAGMASLSIIVPIAAFWLYRARVEATLAGWKDWLIRNNAGVVIVLLLVFGSLITGNGLKILVT